MGANMSNENIIGREHVIFQWSLPKKALVAKELTVIKSKKHNSAKLKIPYRLKLQKIGAFYQLCVMNKAKKDCGLKLTIFGRQDTLVLGPFIISSSEEENYKDLIQTCDLEHYLVDGKLTMVADIIFLDYKAFVLQLHKDPTLPDYINTYPNASILKVGNKESKAHKFILSARSPIFDSMFKANAHGKKSKMDKIVLCLTASPVFNSVFKNHVKVATNGDLVIKGFSHECVKQVIDIIYNGRFTVKDADVLQEVIRFVDNFKIKGAMEFIATQFKDLLTFENARQMIEIAYTHGSDELIDEVKKFVRRNTKHHTMIKSLKAMDVDLMTDLLIGDGRYVLETYH